MELRAKFAEKQPIFWLVSALVLIAAATLSLPQHFDLGLARYLPLHTAMETFSIVVAMLIFTVGINTNKEKASTNLVLLSSAFLAVGLLDFGHALSYAGMPDFVTVSGPEKAIFFWLAARMIAALALLAVAVLPWQKEMAERAQTAFLAALALSGVIYWIILFHQDALPRVFDAATGLTPLKRGMEYLLVGIYAATFIVFYRRKQEPQSYDVNLILAAVAVMGLSEFFFASYANVSDASNLLGHVYKVIAYYLLYRAIFAQAIRAPYLQLVESERSLRESEERYRMIIETSAEGIWLIDQHHITVFANPKMAEMLGYAHAAQLIGHSMLDFMEEPDKVLAANALQRHRQGISEQHEFRFRRRDGGELWVNLSTSPIVQHGEYLGALGMATDITERRRAAKIITELQYRKQLVLDNIGDGICGLDADGLVHFINPAAANMLGYSVNELLGRPLHAVSHHTRADGSSYPARECPILGSLKRGSRSHENGELFWRRDGTSFPVEYSSIPVLESDDENIRVVVTFSDITLRKQAEKLLQESEERFRTLFGSIQDAIFVLPVHPDGTPGKFIEVNEVACRMLGHTREELLDMTIADVDDPDAGVDPAPFAKRLMAGESVIFEQMHKAKDGRRIAVEVNANPFILAGKPVVMSLVRDISERRHAQAMLRWSEERFRSTFEQAAVGMAHAMPNGKFLRLNQKFCEIVGYPRAELLGMTFRDITFPDDLEKDISYMRQALAGEIATFTMEKRYVRKDKTLVWVSLTVSLLRTEDGTPDYFIAVIENITERKRAEQQLRDLSAHLQTVREEEKASIAREIHDDLGGTLTALKMDLYWLARKLPADKEATPLLERAESMSLLLDNAVAVTRRIITELRPSILDDLGLLAAIEWQAAQFHKRTGIECRVSCAEDKGRLGKKRSITLFRILQEALTNVMRHSCATSVDIEFRHSDTAVSLRISDNGRGLPEKHIVSPTSYGIRGIFERAGSLGGHVGIESPRGGGLIVTAILPLQNDTIEEIP